MSHALIWSEISTTDLTSEVKKEIPFAGFGTNVVNTWTKKIFKLKWLNTSVTDTKIWLKNPYAEFYTNDEFAKIKNTSLFHITNDLNFDFRITKLDDFNIQNLPNAKAATNSNIGSTTITGTSKLLAPSYIDGVKIDTTSLVLVKNQTSISENGLYKVLTQQSSTANTTLAFYNYEEILTAGKIVSVGSSSYYSYLEGYKPFEFASYGSTDVIWVDRTSTYKLKNVNAATVSNLGVSGSALTVPGGILDNKTLNLNDRILVKDQTNNIQNGIYYVSSLYESNKNSIVNPNTSTNSLDYYWDQAVFNILQKTPVSAQILKGNDYGGRYYRQYLTSDSEVMAYTILEEGGESGTSSIGSTLQSGWVDATHFYSRTSTNWFYEIGVGSSIGFSYDNLSNAGTLTSCPSHLLDYNNSSTLTSIGQSILIKHYNKASSGIYTIQSVGLGNTSVWVRHSNFDSPNDFDPFIVQTLNNTSDANSQYQYINKSNTYLSNFILNINDINVSSRYLPYYYEPASNLITSEISNFDRVNSTLFNYSGIAISQRVIVAGQATTESQNGIYTVAANGSTLGLSYYSTFSIKNGSIANSSGVGSTYFLFSTKDYVSAGSTSVEWVDISSAPKVTATHISSVDKFTSGEYISPDDFSSDVDNSSIVFVNTTNKNVNGLYNSTLGTPRKAIFDYSTGLTYWIADIYRNILSNTTDGKYTVSPNLRNQISGILISRKYGGFADTTYATSTFGNVYVPEISFPSYGDYDKYFTEQAKGSALLQELDIDWYPQDYQNYSVKAIFKSNSISGLPISSGTAISTKISNNSLINNNDEVLFYIGNGISSESNYNGIYRAVISSAGSSVYFRKHEDFDISTEFDFGTNYKNNGTPYERPTKVLISNGYMIGGSSFANTSVYMQGVIGYKVNTTSLGSTSITPYDDTYYNIGIESFTRNSSVLLSYDYDNLFTFPKIAPIQHFLDGDLKNSDIVNGDILIVNRGYELYTTFENKAVKYYYELGDRVIYQDVNEDLKNSNLTPSTNGIYVVSLIDRNSWTYHLRKVKQNASLGHIDYYRRLKIHSSGNIDDGAFYLTKFSGDGSTYYWNKNNYNDYDVFTISENGTRTNFVNGIDYEIYPDQGYIASYSSFGVSTDTFYCYLYQNSNIPRFDSYPKPLYNRYHIVEQVLKYKEFANSGYAKTSGSYSFDNRYFQLSNLSGAATTLDYKNNTDRNLWYNELNLDKVFNSSIKHLVSIDSTDNYFITTRQSIDGYSRKVSTGFTANFYDYNLVDPGTGRSTGIFTGTLYLEKVINSGTALTNWYSSFGLTSGENILIISNTNSSIAATFQSSYYNDADTLVKHNKSGKRDQKIYTFNKLGYTPVTLSYNANFTNPLSPLIVFAGISTYYLHYNPNATNRSSDPRSWYDFEGVEKFTYTVASNSNLTNLSDFGGVISGKSISSNDVILIKNQTNKKQNGIYSVISNNLYKLSRSSDLSTANSLKALGRVELGNRTFEMILPTGTYSIGSTSGNTPIAWKLVGFGQTIDAGVATSTNYSGTALTSAMPDVIDGITLNNNDLVLLLNQTDAAERYVGRFVKTLNSSLMRVGVGGFGDTSLFSITNCYVLDTNRNREYELYFNPSNTGVGTSGVNWFQRNYISDYNNADLKSTSNVNISSVPNIPNQESGSIVLLKDQTTKSQNGIYIIDNYSYYFLTRHDDLDQSSEINIAKRVNVLGGNTNSGYYGLVYDESITPTIDSTNLYWVEVNLNTTLEDCLVASTTNINLSNPPSTIDDVLLENDNRILVKDQTSPLQNGIYIVKDKKNGVWTRSTDLNSNSQLIPQLSVKIVKGYENSNKIYRIKLSTPSTITNTQTTPYTIGTNNINWIEVDSLGLYESDPSTWQKIGTGVSDAFYLGTSKMNLYSVSNSNRFAIAFKSPSSSTFTGFGISNDGKIRNFTFGVEYKTIED
jgi:hypothetical protein